MALPRNLPLLASFHFSSSPVHFSEIFHQKLLLVCLRWGFNFYWNSVARFQARGKKGEVSLTACFVNRFIETFLPLLSWDNYFHKKLENLIKSVVERWRNLSRGCGVEWWLTWREVVSRVICWFFCSNQLSSSRWSFTLVSLWHFPTTQPRHQRYLHFISCCFNSRAKPWTNIWWLIKFATGLCRRQTRLMGDESWSRSIALPPWRRLRRNLSFRLNQSFDMRWQRPSVKAPE